MLEESSKRAFPTGVRDRWQNCLLIYWRNVAQRTTTTSICLLLRHDSAKCRRQRSRNLFSFSCAYSAQTVRPSTKLNHERHILGMSTGPRNDSHCPKLCRLSCFPITNTPRKYPFQLFLGPVKPTAQQFGNFSAVYACAHRFTCLFQKCL